MAHSNKSDLNGVVLDFIDDCEAETIEWPNQQAFARAVEERFASQEEEAAA
jgi:hypothetical protein